MQSFKDTKGRAWEVVIDVTAMKRVRQLLSIDLYKLVDEGAKGLGELLNDPCQLVDILYVLCREQAEKAGLTDEDFGRGFSGDSLEAGANAFVAALLDFFPSRQGRATLQKVMDKGKSLGTKLMDRANRELDAIDLDSLAAKWKPSVGSVAVGSASTPDA